jgi:adenosylcobinamide-GDP ribazoletransferase
LNPDRRPQIPVVEADVVQSQKSHPLPARLVAAPLAAASFLTVAPIPLPPSLVGGAMGWATVCFPLVGAAMGLALTGLDRLLSGWLPTPVVAALLLAALLALTGALHLDGLMDGFDGLFGGRDPERRLAIMRDSRVGSYGIAAASSVLLAEYGCLVSLSPEARTPALILALALSRWAMVATLWAFPAASPLGLGSLLKPQLTRPRAAGATILALALAVSWQGLTGLGLVAVAGALVAMGGGLARSRLGGVTGDICGGLGQLVEAVVMVACVGIFGSTRQF